MVEDEKALQDEATWDFSQETVSPGIKKARAVVSVAFAREDFGQVSNAARQSNMKTSEFIRNAALAQAKAITYLTSFGWSGISGGGSITDGPSIAGTSSKAISTVINDSELASTY